MTEWRPIAGQEGRYEVSDEGQVRSLDRVTRGRLFRGQVLSPAPNPAGYLTVALLRIDGGSITQRVHRLVAEAFLGPRPAGMHTCHNDGDQKNNAAANLRYDTQSSNELDKVRHGTSGHTARTHCLRGHEFTPDNTSFEGATRRQRRCRTCRREREARAYWAARAEPSLTAAS